MSRHKLRPALRHAMRRVRSGWTPSFLLRDDFTADDAAPLTSPRTCEPGPGTLTAVQTDGTLAVSGGKLAFTAQGTPAWGDQGIYDATGYNRISGRALFSQVNLPLDLLLSWIEWRAAASLGNPADANGQHAILFADTTRRLIWTIGTTSITLQTAWTLSQMYTGGILLRTSGAFYVMKGGTEFPTWIVVWIDNIAAGSPLYAAMNGYSANGTLDNFRVIDLPAPFDDDYGLATQRVAGSVSAEQMFTHEADCIIEWTDTTIPSASNLDLRFRRQDATNYWQITIDSTGALVLNEVVAGTPTSRGSSAGAVSNGNRVVVIASGTTIKVYSANVLKITYASASNFTTATAGELVALGTSGVVSDLIAWPRTLGAAAGAILDQAVA